MRHCKPEKPGPFPLTVLRPDLFMITVHTLNLRRPRLSGGVNHPDFAILARWYQLPRMVLYLSDFDYVFTVSARLALLALVDGFMRRCILSGVHDQSSFPPSPKLPIASSVFPVVRSCHVSDIDHNRSFLTLPSYLPGCFDILPKADQERPTHPSACLPVSILQLHHRDSCSPPRSSARL